MWSEEVGTWMLRSDTEGEKIEAQLREFIVDLERQGAQPKCIATALSRVLLGFCAEHGRDAQHFAFAITTLGVVADLMQHQTKAARRVWVKRFLTHTQRLYHDARFRLDFDSRRPPSLPPFAVDISTPQGQA